MLSVSTLKLHYLIEEPKPPAAMHNKNIHPKHNNKTANEKLSELFIFPFFTIVVLPTSVVFSTAENVLVIFMDIAIIIVLHKSKQNITPSFIVPPRLNQD